MSLFGAPGKDYSEAAERSFRGTLERVLASFYRRNESIELAPGAFIYARSPDGNRWQLSVSNAGAVVVTAA